MDLRWRFCGYGRRRYRCGAIVFALKRRGLHPLPARPEGRLVSCLRRRSPERRLTSSYAAVNERIPSRCSNLRLLAVEPPRSGWLAGAAQVHGQD